MKAVFAVSAAALFSGALAQSKVSVNTPAQLTECQPIQIAWSGGTPPYFLSVFPDGQPGTTLEQLISNTTSTSFTWLVNIASGQSVGFAVDDSTGVVGQSAAVPIQAGSSTSCVGQSASGSAGAGTTGSSPASTGGSGASTTSAPASSGTSGTGTTNAAGSSTGSSTSTSSSSSTSSNAASSQSAQLGFAGIVGAALVALFA